MRVGIAAGCDEATADVFMGGEGAEGACERTGRRFGERALWPAVSADAHERRLHLHSAPQFNALAVDEQRCNVSC